MRRALFVLLACAAGCATPPFQPQFQKPATPSERVVLSEITRDKPRDERPVAVGITTEPERLFAWDLSAGLLWERPVSAKSAPLVVADAVVMQEASGIVVRDLTSGEIRAEVDDQGHLIGADGEGRSIALAIGYDGADPRAAVAFVEGNGLRWKQPLNLPVGVPALIGGYVLVPWATQRLSVLSARDGRELARWDFPHEVLGLALCDRGGVYVGQHGLMRFGADMLEQPEKQRVHYAPEKRTLPGQPPLLRDGYLPVPEPKNAYHQLRLDWRVSEREGGMAAENDLMLLRFYRLLFALEAHADGLRWVRSFDHDLVGAAIQPGGMFVADTAGALYFLDGKGVTRMQRDLGRTLEVLTIRPGAWVPAPAEDASAAEPPALGEQLFTAAALHDDRLVAGRAYAIEHLARIADPAVTPRLIALCADRKNPDELKNAACASLAQRTSGSDDVLRALATRASFLDGSEAPPSGALAQAAAQMQLKQAAPLIVSQMEDPSTPVRELVPLLSALEQLGHQKAGPSLERFVRLHHAEPEGSEIAPALYAAMHAIGALKWKSAQKTLLDVADDPLTPDAVRLKAREAVNLLDAPPAPAKDTKAEAPPEQEADKAAEIEDPRPYALTAELVRNALRPVSKQLSQCVANDPGHPRSARLSMVVQGQGRVEGVFAAPTTLQACVEPLVRNVEFPATKSGRQRVTQTVFGPNAAAPPPVKKKRSAGALKRSASDTPGLKPQQGPKKPTATPAPVTSPAAPAAKP